MGYTACIKIYLFMSFGVFQIYIIMPLFTGDLAAAFEKHVATYGGLDICINSAGIGSPVPFNKDQTDGSKSWRLTINVNLVAVIECTRIAVCWRHYFYSAVN